MITGLRTVVVYTGMANAVRSGLASEQESLKQLGSIPLLCTGNASVPPNASSVAFISTSCP